MENSNGGRTCPKCGMNLGQRHLCPVCDIPPESERPHGGRTCPKCGMNLGQKHLCPVCDKTETEQENTNGSVASTSSQGGDYVSRVIEFIGGHPNDWDEEFNAFFDGQMEDHDYMECHVVCSKVSGLFQKDMPVFIKITGSMTINAMNELKRIFPDLSDKDARLHALRLLEKRAESIPTPLPLGSSAKVMELYRKAVEQNDSYAQNNLGYAYAHGEGVNEDKTEAVKWYLKSAKQGNQWGMYHLGECYLNGEGVSKNLKEAVKWYRKAAEWGSEYARKRLKELGQ